MRVRLSENAPKADSKNANPAPAMFDVSEPVLASGSCVCGVCASSTVSSCIGSGSVSGSGSVTSSGSGAGIIGTGIGSGSGIGTGVGFGSGVTGVGSGSGLGGSGFGGSGFGGCDLGFVTLITTFFINDMFSG